jgi:hypothetical protein
MKKRLLLILLGAALVAGSVIGGVQFSDRDATFNANLEALTFIEHNTVDCFSSSEYWPGESYYDCGECKKEENKRGKLDQRTCEHFYNVVL